MSTIRTILHRSGSLLAVGRIPAHTADAFEARGITDLHNLDYHALVSTPNVGKTSIEYLTIALRDEVLRLQAVVDAVHAALDVKGV